MSNGRERRPTSSRDTAEAAFKKATARPADLPPPKPVETSTTWLAPGNYDLLLANFTSVGETASVKVNLSSVGCATP